MTGAVLPDQTGTAASSQVTWASCQAERRAWGGDRFDEVWDGVYVMSPIANNQRIWDAGLGASLRYRFW